MCIECSHKHCAIIAKSKSGVTRMTRFPSQYGICLPWNCFSYYTLKTRSAWGFRIGSFFHMSGYWVEGHIYIWLLKRMSYRPVYISRKEVIYMYDISILQKCLHKLDALRKTDIVHKIKKCSQTEKNVG